MRTRELSKGIALLAVSIFWVYQAMFHVHSLVS